MKAKRFDKANKHRAKKHVTKRAIREITRLVKLSEGQQSRA